jgi:hypothetical protein
VSNFVHELVGRNEALKAIERRSAVEMMCLVYPLFDYVYPEPDEGLRELRCSYLNAS